MIHRSYVTCATCNHVHTLRIGIGNANTQKHLFSCAGCKENIGVTVVVTHPPLELEMSFENATASNTEGTVINLDSDFLVSKSATGPNQLMSRLEQKVEQLRAQQNIIDTKHGAGSFLRMLEGNSVREISLPEEWDLLKKTWSLSRNNQKRLTEDKIREINQTIYKNEPIDGIHDWLWSFSSKVCSGHYENLFWDIITDIKPILAKEDERRKFMVYFNEKLFPKHEEIYFKIFKQFFSEYSSFTQVFTRCQLNLDFPDNLEVSTKDFDSLNMFYGNAYEAFTTLVETIACLNNIDLGRSFDSFQEMNLKKYQTLDKSGRCKSFENNLKFSAICKNLDGQLRNASHHGSFKLDQKSGEIKYVSGKGGVGTEKSISFTQYLYKCSHLFLSIATIFRIELALSISPSDTNY